MEKQEYPVLQMLVPHKVIHPDGQYPYTLKVTVCDNNTVVWSDYDNENHYVAIMTAQRSGIFVTIVESRVDPCGPTTETSIHDTVTDALCFITRAILMPVASVAYDDARHKVINLFLESECMEQLESVLK